MQYRKALAFFLLASVLLTGCSRWSPAVSISESPPDTAFTETAEDTRMIVNAETEQTTLEIVFEASAAATFSQEADEPEIGEETVPANPSTETKDPFVDETTEPTQEALPQPTTESKPTSPGNPTEPPETSPPTEQPSEKPTDPPPETQHIHSWGGWTQTKAPTCGAPGEETRTCISCGATETRPVTATGKHTWTEKAPSCTETGERTCSVCGAKETLTTLGHSWVRHDEEGCWVTIIVCYCGEQFRTATEWDAHANASSDLEYLDAHAGYYAYEEWEVSSPAYDSCSRCGEVKNP